MSEERRDLGSAPRGGVSRRGALALGGIAAVAAGTYAVSRGLELPSLPAVSGFSAPAPPELRVDPVPVEWTALEARRSVGAAVHAYEVTGREARYFVTPDVASRLESWLALHRQHVGHDPDEIRTFGAWVRGSSTSWHSSGQAIDIARLRGGGADLVSLRHDQWRDEPTGALNRRLALYWRTAAGLHHEFADVLTYLFDDAHANHIHVDVGRFGPERPRLIRRSRVQAQAVQAMCRHVWGRTDVEITGVYDDATRDATTRILEQVGGPGELADSRAAWQAFMVATMRRG